MSYGFSLFILIIISVELVSKIAIRESMLISVWMHVADVYKWKTMIIDRKSIEMIVLNPVSDIRLARTIYLAMAESAIPPMVNDAHNIQGSLAIASKPSSQYKIFIQNFAIIDISVSTVGTAKLEKTDLLA